MHAISQAIGFSQISLDPSKPDGPPRKLMNSPRNTYLAGKPEFVSGMALLLSMTIPR